MQKSTSRTPLQMTPHEDTMPSRVVAIADRPSYKWARCALVMAAAACVLNLGEYRVKVK